MQKYRYRIRLNANVPVDLTEGALQAMTFGHDEELDLVEVTPREAVIETNAEMANLVQLMLGTGGTIELE